MTFLTDHVLPTDSVDNLEHNYHSQDDLTQDDIIIDIEDFSNDIENEETVSTYPHIKKFNNNNNMSIIITIIVEFSLSKKVLPVYRRELRVYVNYIECLFIHFYVRLYFNVEKFSRT